MPSRPVSPSRAVVLAFVLAVLASAASASRMPAPAAAANFVAGAPNSAAALGAPLIPLAQRRGGGFRARPRISPNRPATRNRPVTRRNPNTGRALRNFTRGLLQALGIAFLLSLLFGIGPGGSPLGLLLLLGIVALVVIARRRRHHYGYR